MWVEVNTRKQREIAYARARARARVILEEFVRLDPEWDREFRAIVETVHMDGPMAWRHLRQHYYGPWDGLWRTRTRVLRALRHFPAVADELLRQQGVLAKQPKPTRYALSARGLERILRTLWR